MSTTTLRATTRTAVVALSVVLIATIVGFSAYFFHQGYRWYIVATPSMGAEAPRGSLLITEPTTVADTHVGDFITFKSPETGVVFSHRVIGITDEGLQTQGDINPVPDAWTITNDDLIGEVVWNKQGIGWILKGLPLIILGTIVVFIATGWTRPTRRYSYRVVGVSVVVAIVGWILKPWVGLAQLGQRVPIGNPQGLLVDVVSTGVLPITVAPEGTTHDSPQLFNGDTTTISFAEPTHGHDYLFSTDLALTLWWWIGIVAICLIPMLWCLLVGLPPVEDDNQNRTDDPGTNNIDDSALTAATP